jgi:hypothetical protein
MDIVEEFRKLAEVYKEQGRQADENARASRDSAIANNGARQGVEKCIEIMLKANAPTLKLVGSDTDGESK